MQCQAGLPVRYRVCGVPEPVLHALPAVAAHQVERKRDLGGQGARTTPHYQVRDSGTMLQLGV